MPSLSPIAVCEDSRWDEYRSLCEKQEYAWASGSPSFSRDSKKCLSALMEIVAVPCNDAKLLLDIHRHIWNDPMCSIESVCSAFGCNIESVKRVCKSSGGGMDVVGDTLRVFVKDGSKVEIGNDALAGRCLRVIVNVPEISAEFASIYLCVPRVHVIASVMAMEANGIIERVPGVNSVGYQIIQGRSAPNAKPKKAKKIAGSVASSELT